MEDFVTGISAATNDVAALGAAAENVTEPAIWFVVVMGIVTVFVGLIFIILICKLISAAAVAVDKKISKSAVSAQPAVEQKSNEIPDRQEFIAAVSAAIAEEIGSDISKIRICSVKRV